MLVRFAGLEQNETYLVSDFLESLEERVGRVVVASLALNRLHYDPGHRSAFSLVLFEQVLNLVMKQVLHWGRSVGRAIVWISLGTQKRRFFPFIHSIRSFLLFIHSIRSLHSFYSALQS